LVDGIEEEDRKKENSRDARPFDFFFFLGDGQQKLFLRGGKDKEELF
jgi:hypothetical protein